MTIFTARNFCRTFGGYTAVSAVLWTFAGIPLFAMPYEDPLRAMILVMAHMTGLFLFAATFVDDLWG